MREQVRVSRAGVATLLLFSVLLGAWQGASVQVPIIITLPTAGETTLFSDNFDTYPAGSFPSAGGWEVVWGGTGQNLIVSDPCVSWPNAFQLWGKPNWSAVVQRKFSTTAPIIGYEYAIRIEKIGTGGPGREESPAFFNRDVATWGGYYAMVQFCHDTRRIKTVDGTVLGQWSPGVWYRVKVILDRRTNLFSVWIDGRLAGQNIHTAGDTYQINALALFSGHPGVKVWYDDVRVFAQTPVHSVSIPNAPLGPAEGKVGESLSFSVSGGECSEPGHLPEYRFDWGDGSFSEWLNILAFKFSLPTHAWGKEGTYQVRVQSRCAADTSIVSAWSPAKTVTIRAVPTVGEWHIDFQGDANHGRTRGQAGPIPHTQPGVYWNVFEVAALKEPWPTPRSTNPSMMLKDRAGNPTAVTFSIRGDAYGWAGLSGAHSLLGDYLIHMNFNAHGVLNNPTWWKISGLAPNTRYCLTFYHALTGAHDRGLVFGVLHAFHTSLVEVAGVPGRNVASECVTSSGEGTITAWVKVDDRLGVEGNWAGLTILADPESSRIESVLAAIEEELAARIHLPEVAHAISALQRSRAFFFQHNLDAGLSALADAATHLQPVDQLLSDNLAVLAEIGVLASVTDGLGGFVAMSWSEVWDLVKTYGSKAWEAIKKAKAWLDKLDASAKKLAGVGLRTILLAGRLIHLLLKYEAHLVYCYRYCDLLDLQARIDYCGNTNYFACVKACLIKRGIDPDKWWWELLKDATPISTIESLLELLKDLYDCLKGLAFGHAASWSGP